MSYDVGCYRTVQKQVDHGYLVQCRLPSYSVENMATCFKHRTRSLANLPAPPPPPRPRLLAARYVRPLRLPWPALRSLRIQRQKKERGRSELARWLKNPGQRRRETNQTAVKWSTAHIDVCLIYSGGERGEGRGSSMTVFKLAHACYGTTVEVNHLIPTAPYFRGLSFSPKPWIWREKNVPPDEQ